MAKTRTSVVPAGSRAAVLRIQSRDTAAHTSNNIAKRSVTANGYAPLGKSWPNGVKLKQR